MNRKSSHLIEEAALVVETGNPEERIRYLERRPVILYPRMKNLLDVLEGRLNHPKVPRMPNLLVIGESNIGKTTIINRFVASHPVRLYEDETGAARHRIPVLSIIAPEKPEPRDLFIAILGKFHTAFRPNDTVAKLRHQTYHLMRKSDAGMLVIDEIHNFLETTPVKQRLIMNTLKNLGNELMIPIVAVGTEISARILSSDPQLASRFDVARLPAWKLDRDFLGLLRSFEKTLPLEEPSELYGREKATLLYGISRGNLGDLNRLLTQCTAHAIRNGKEKITVETIRKHSWLRPASTGRSVEIPLC